MRIAIIGAGAVGGTIAALLARAGHEVAVTARGAHLEAIRGQGIELAGAWGNYTARVEASPVLSTSPDFAIIATKAQDATAAISANAEQLRNRPVLVVQNGLEAISAARMAAPHSEIMGALATFAASYLSPGRITVTTAGPSYLGATALGSTRTVSDTLGAVMPITVINNFAGAQWTKLIINQVNALPAITGLSVQETVAHPGLRLLMTASMREAVRIGFASGIRFEALQGLGQASLRLFSLLPLRLGQALPLLMNARIGSVPNPGSTLQSIRRGQSTEIDYLNGAVVRAARALQREAPVNARLVQLVHLVESRGRFFDPDEVLAQSR